VANRWQEFQIETKLSHELFISNQTLNAPAPLNVRTGVNLTIFQIGNDSTR
jgi:hypothetical protein